MLDKGMPNDAERYAATRYHHAELCRIMLLCRLCRTHAIMPIYYAGIKGHAQSIRHPTSTQRTLSRHIAYRNKHARYQNKNAEHLPSNIIMGTKSVLKSQSDSTHGGHTHPPTEPQSHGNPKIQLGPPCCTRAVLVLVLGIPTAVGELTVGELIFSHSYNFYFGREFALGATIGAMAKFAHVTNRHKISYKLNVEDLKIIGDTTGYRPYVSGLIVVFVPSYQLLAVISCFLGGVKKLEMMLLRSSA
jgi:hypothetical protein